MRPLSRDGARLSDAAQDPVTLGQTLSRVIGDADFEHQFNAFAAERTRAQAEAFERVYDARMVRIAVDGARKNVDERAYQALLDKGVFRPVANWRHYHVWLQGKGGVVIAHQYRSIVLGDIPKRERRHISAAVREIRTVEELERAIDVGVPSRMVRLRVAVRSVMPRGSADGLTSWERLRLRRLGSNRGTLGDAVAQATGNHRLLRDVEDDHRFRLSMFDAIEARDGAAAAWEYSRRFDVNGFVPTLLNHGVLERTPDGDLRPTNDALTALLGRTPKRLARDRERMHVEAWRSWRTSRTVD
jgi:hypothetical protein